MAKKLRTHLMIGDSPLPSGLRPKHLTKQEFARRLYQLMLSKGWHQAELARQASNAAPDGVEVSRDNVSTYIRGTSLPSPPKVAALAAAFGIEPQALLPNYTESAIDEDSPSFEMKASDGEPGRAWVRVNRLVTFDTATKIAALLQDDTIGETNDNAPHGSRRR